MLDHVCIEIMIDSRAALLNPSVYFTRVMRGGRYGVLLDSTA